MPTISRSDQHPQYDHFHLKGSVEPLFGQAVDCGFGWDAGGVGVCGSGSVVSSTPTTMDYFLFRPTYFRAEIIIFEMARPPSGRDRKSVNMIHRPFP